MTKAQQLLVGSDIELLRANFSEASFSLQRVSPLFYRIASHRIKAPRSLAFLVVMSYIHFVHVAV